MNDLKELFDSSKGYSLGNEDAPAFELIEDSPYADRAPPTAEELEQTLYATARMLSSMDIVARLEWVAELVELIETPSADAPAIIDAIENRCI